MRPEDLKMHSIRPFYLRQPNPLMDCLLTCGPCGRSFFGTSENLHTSDPRCPHCLVQLWSQEVWLVAIAVLRATGDLVACDDALVEGQRHEAEARKEAL